MTKHLFWDVFHVQEMRVEFILAVLYYPWLKCYEHGPRESTVFHGFEFSFDIGLLGRVIVDPCSEPIRSTEDDTGLAKGV